MGNTKSSEKEAITSISLENSLFKAAKHYAVEANMKFKDVISEALKEYLSSKGVQLTSEE